MQGDFLQVSWSCKLLLPYSVQHFEDMTLFVNVGSFWCFKQYHSSWFQIPSSVYPPPPSPPPPSLHPYYATAYGCGVQGAQRYVYILFLRIYVYISNSFVMLDVFVVCSPMLMRYCTKEMTIITIIIIYIIFVHFVIHSVCSFFLFFSLIWCRQVWQSGRWYVYFCY